MMARRGRVVPACQEPSWKENMELRFDLAINYELGFVDFYAA
jgi:hypothetical protein